MWLRAVAVALVLLPAGPLAAQGIDPPPDQPSQESPEDNTSAEELLERSRKVYGPPAPIGTCKEDPQNAEIVVCAEEEDQSRYRVQSTSELDPEGDAATKDNIPRAPDFNAPPCVPSLLTLCSKFGGAPPPAVMIDFSKLPEAPEGSDADLIAKGKKPAD